MNLNPFKKSQILIGGESSESLLDQTLYTFPNTKTPVSWADAIEGTLITGSTGSGKSSGAGRHIALSMLRSGFGMCILCAKPGEAKIWEGYANEANRIDDLVVFNKQSGLKFNFLEYELKRLGEGAGETINIVNALMNLNEQNRIHLSGGDGKEEPFWNNSIRRLISRSIDLLKQSSEEVSISNIRKVISMSFTDDDLGFYNLLKSKIEVEKEIDQKERNKAKDDLEGWRRSNYFVKCIEHIKSSKHNNEDVNTLLNYWLFEFPKLSERTRSIIIESFMGIVEPFLNQGILKDHFSGGSSEDLKPENIILHKKIIVIDFSAKEFGFAGIYASSIYKTTFQAAMERRNIDEETSPKPVGLWIDEYQNFVSPMTDSLFQTTARSSWVASVYITQSIQNLYFAMGGKMPEARTKSLLGNLNLKIFCSNSDFENNEWASKMIGQHLIYRQNISTDKNSDISQTQNQEKDFRISPEDFTTLKTGRKKNKNIVEAVIFKAGKSWGREEENYAVVEFKQKVKY